MPRQFLQRSISRPRRPLIIHMQSYPSLRAPPTVNLPIRSLVESVIYTPLVRRDPAPSLDLDSPYLPAEDISILKSILAYYGPAFLGDVPRSFWSTYRRATGSRRSKLSLQTHWSSYLKKRYRSFVINGGLDDWIALLERSQDEAQRTMTALYVESHGRCVSIGRSGAGPPPGNGHRETEFDLSLV
jgi:hypothetical protein